VDIDLLTVRVYQEHNRSSCSGACSRTRNDSDVLSSLHFVKHIFKRIYDLYDID